MEVRVLIAVIATFFFIFAAHLFFLQRRQNNRLKKANAALSRIRENSATGVFRLKRQGCKWLLADANDAYYKFAGYTKKQFEEAHGGFADELILMTVDEADIKKIRSDFAKNKKTATEIHAVLLNGVSKWAWFVGEYIDNGGEEDEIIGFVSDVTERRESVEKADSSKERFMTGQKLTHDFLFEWDLKTRVVTYSPNFTRFYGVPSVAADFPRCAVGLGRILAEDVPGFLDAYERAKCGQKHTTIEYRTRMPDGGESWFRDTITTIFNESGDPVKVIGKISRIDAEKKRLKKAEEAAKRDTLTQLYNRKATEDLIKDYVMVYDTPAAMMIIDIDKFKDINDSMGNLYGDAVLSELAHTLQRFLRDTDIIGRIGGDEFLVFMPDVSDSRLIERKASEILRAFESSYKSIGGRLGVTGSIGISRYPDDGIDFAGLFDKADIALYHAKRHGMNRAVLYREQAMSDDRPDANMHKAHEQADFIRAERQRNFRENVADYMLKIFYEYNDVEKSIGVLLDFVGRAYHLGRIEVILFSDDDKYLSCAYEWCSGGVEPQKDAMKQVPADDWRYIKPLLDEDNIYLMHDAANVPENCFDNDNYLKRGVKAAITCYVVENDKRRAAIGFEFFTEKKAFTDEEVEAAKVITRTICLFVVRDRERQLTKEILTEQRNREAMLDESDDIVYVADPYNYDLIYINRKGREGLSIDEADVKKRKCYETIRGESKPCSSCTNHLLREDRYYVWETINPLTGRRYMLRDKLFRWGGRLARVEWATEIDKIADEMRMSENKLEFERILQEGADAMSEAATLDEAMTSALKRIAEFYGADRSYIIEPDADGSGAISMTYEWSESAPMAASFQKMKLADVPFWADGFKNQDTAIIDDLEYIREKFPVDYKRISEWGITSLTAVPFRLDGKLAGYVGIDNPKAHLGDIYVLAAISSFVADEMTARAGK